jgi:hypothetical protein
MGIIKNKFFAAIFLLPLLFSCTTHYVATWQNADPHSVITDEGNYAIKNDTIGITHSFNSPSGKVLVRMENYSDHPILVNLTKSAMTINGRTFGYIDGRSTFYGRLDQFGNPDTGSFGTFDGEIAGKTNTLFIPPSAFIESEFTDVSRETRNIIGENFQGDRTLYPVFNNPVQTKIAFYENDNSPMKLTSYLNYSILDANNQPLKTNIISQNYFLSSMASLQNFSQNQLNQNLASRDDMSSYSFTKGRGVGWIFFLGGLIGLAIVLDEVTPDE